jgi:RNA polymerase sigma-70 factor (ECF subfamily)
MAVIAEVALRGNPHVRFEELYSSCQPRVFRTCLAILRNADDAAEATQEVFSRALPLVTELREPHLWLQTVARNYCLDQLRRQKVRGGGGAALDDDTPDTRDDPEREALLRDALRQAFSALSPRERRALGRVLLMDDSLADIAGMLGISYGAAAQVVSRARRRAAMAARAVIGASLAWLARLSLPRERGRATRVAAQVLESSQNIVLAAAVVLTAGTVATGTADAVAGGGGGSGSTVVLQTAPAGDRADVNAVAPALAGGASAGLSGAAALPAGSTISAVHAVQQPRSSGPGAPVGPQPSTSFALHVSPVVSSSCVGADVEVTHLDGSRFVDQRPQACRP